MRTTLVLVGALATAAAQGPSASSKLSWTETAALLRTNLSSDAINGLRRIGLWKDEIDFADLKARMMELQRLTDASTPGPFECRNASAARQWARAPSRGAGFDWLYHFLASRRQCAMSLLNAMLDDHGLNGMLVADPAWGGGPRHAVGRFLSAGTRERRSDAYAVADALVENARDFIPEIHGFVWEDVVVQCDALRRRSLDASAVDTAADASSSRVLNDTERVARVVWRRRFRATAAARSAKDAGGRRSRNRDARASSTVDKAAPSPDATR